MDKYAIVKIGGSQYKISEEEEITIDKIKADKKIVFDQVLLINDGKKIIIGQPYIKKAQVEAEVIQQLKGPKIRVATFKAKARQRKVKGFRPQLTKLKILKITN